MIVSTSPHSAPNSTPAATVNIGAGQRGDRDDGLQRDEQHAGPTRPRRRPRHAPRPRRPTASRQTPTTTAASTAINAATSRPHLTCTNGTGPVRVIAASRGDRRTARTRSPGTIGWRDHPAERAQVRQQGAQRAGPVRRRVLLRRRQLGRRPRLPLRHEDRVVAEAVGAPRRAGEAARSTRRAPRSRARRAPRAPRRRRTPPRAARRGRRRSGPARSSRLARSSPWRPLQRADSTPGIPFSASTVRPESSATDGSPVAAAASRALARAFSANVAPVSGASGNSGTSASPTDRRTRREHPPQLDELARVAGGEQHARCAVPTELLTAARPGRARPAPPPAGR